MSGLGGDVVAGCGRIVGWHVLDTCVEATAGAVDALSAILTVRSQ